MIDRRSVTEPVSVVLDHGVFFDAELSMQDSILATCYLLLTVLKASALNAPLVACIETLLEG